MHAVLPQVWSDTAGAALVYDDAERWIAGVLGDDALRNAVCLAVRRHDLRRPPLQIARLVHDAIAGGGAPVRLTTAAALVHVGAGVHDDVADGDVARANEAEALLVSGVCLATLAPQAIASVVPPDRLRAALDCTWSSMRTMASGQRRDIALFGDATPDLRSVEAALAKTTGECGLYAALGACVAGCDDDEIAHWQSLGADLGYALQVVSDCQDVVAVDGRDIASGARPLPIALALHDGSQPERAALAEMLDRAGHDVDAEHEARRRIVASRALSACGTLVEARVARAERTLAEIAPAAPSLLAAFIGERSWLRHH